MSEWGGVLEVVGMLLLVSLLLVWLWTNPSRTYKVCQGSYVRVGAESTSSPREDLSQRRSRESRLQSEAGTYIFSIEKYSTHL